MPVPDMPAEKDELGFDRFAVPLARSIAATDQFTTPWTIGVYGEWGSGKTTFLKLVEKELKRTHRVRPIWFNAWKYLREDNLWAALIEEVLAGARKSVPLYRRLDVRLRVWWHSIDLAAGLWEMVRKLSVLGFRIAMVAVLVLMALSVVPVAGNPVAASLSGVPLLRDVWAHGLSEPWARVLIGVVAALASKPDALLKVFDIRLGADLSAFRRRRSHRDQTALMDDFNTEFRAVLKVIYRDKPLVVIIDDLDRCLPEQTLQIIETVKLFLDEPGCVFLLAVDREIIEHAIRVKYKDLPAVGDLGETYFEKVVQLPYSLPPPAESLVESYIQSISPDEDVKACLPILRGASPYNPRRIKRSVQAFTLVKELSADIEPVPAVLAKLVVIQAQFRQVYRVAVNDHSFLAQLEHAYREPESLEGHKDLVFVEQVKRFTETYPALGELLRHKISAEDTFQQLNLVKYLSFVDTVVSAEPPEPRYITPSKLSVVVMHLSEDQRWGQWLTDEAAALGYDARRVTPDAMADVDLEEFDRTLAVLSSASVASSEAQQQWAVAIAADRPLVGVQVDDCDVPELLGTRRVVKVRGLDQAEVRNSLRNALRPVQLSTHVVTGEVHGQLIQARHVDTVVFPGRGAVINNVPVRKPNLVERAELLHGIERSFSSALTRHCALVGMPGSGKTVLAQQYAEANASRYDLVWWIRADHFDTDLAALARALDTSVDQVQSRAAAFGRCLFIYDGADDPAGTSELLSHLRGGHVLLTSVHRGWADYADVVLVDAFTPEQSAQLLGTSDGAAELGEAIGHLPVAVAAAAAYMRDTKTAATRVTGMLGDQRNPVVRALRSTKALDRVAAGKPEVRLAIRVLAQLAPGRISRDLLLALVGEDRDTVDRTMSELYVHSLIDLGMQHVIVHPGVRQAIREFASSSDSASLVEHVLRRGATYLRATRDADAAAVLLPALAQADLMGLRQGLVDLRTSIAIAASGSCVVVATLGYDDGLTTRICAELHGVADGQICTYRSGSHHFVHRDGTDALARLVTAPMRPDCVVVAEAGAAQEELDEQLLVAELVGAGSNIIIGTDDTMSLVEELYQVSQRAETGTVGEYTRFEALVMKRPDAVNAATVSLRGGTRRVLATYDGETDTQHTNSVLLEIDEPMAMAEFDRFQSDELGNGVITRTMK